MLPQAQRLTKTTDVKQGLRGRGFFNPHFTVKYRRTVGLPRFAVIVSTKVSKKAVVRNRIKRLVRETLRTRLPQLQSGDYVIIVRPAGIKLLPKNFGPAFSDFLSKQPFWEKPSP